MRVSINSEIGFLRLCELRQRTLRRIRVFVDTSRGQFVVDAVKKTNSLEELHCSDDTALTISQLKCILRHSGRTLHRLRITVKSEANTNLKPNLCRRIENGREIAEVLCCAALHCYVLSPDDLLGALVRSFGDRARPPRCTPAELEAIKNSCAQWLQHNQCWLCNGTALWLRCKVHLQKLFHPADRDALYLASE